MMQSEHGELDLSIPRDHQGAFEFRMMSLG